MGWVPRVMRAGAATLALLVAGWACGGSTTPGDADGWNEGPTDEDEADADVPDSLPDEPDISAEAEADLSDDLSAEAEADLSDEPGEGDAAADEGGEAPPECGDGVVDLGEECDDGNGIDDDGCRNDCTLPTCEDRIRDGGETDVDCGGPVCAPCADGLRCLVARDCASGDCTEGLCRPGCREFYGACLDTFGLLGQDSYRRTAQGQISGHSAFHAAGVALDATVRPNILYVMDTGHSRILAFRGLGACGGEPARACTDDADCAGGDSCVVDEAKDADLVIGQPDARSGECNGDNNYGYFLAPTATALCLASYPSWTNVSEQWRHTNLEVDGAGDLYAVDVYNNRVLRYARPFGSDAGRGEGDAVADFVWGQPDMVSNGINREAGPDAPAADSLHVSWYWPLSRGVSVDPAGNVWIADQGNSRVLRFPADSGTANLVIGQPDFTTAAADCSWAEDGEPPVRLDRLCHPTAAKVNPDTGVLYVIDEYGGSFGESRVLLFAPPFANGMAAFRQLKPPRATGMRPGPGTDYFFSASGLAFNTYREGAYAAGTFWVNEAYPGSRTVLLDDEGHVLQVLGARNPGEVGGQPQIDWFPDCEYGIPERRLVPWPSGSMAVDGAGAIYLANEEGYNVQRYLLPYELVGEPGGGPGTCLPPPDAVLLGRNPRVPGRLMESVGVAAVGGQLIAKDWRQVKVWNNYPYRAHGADADHVIDLGWAGGPHASFAVDDANRLWTFENLGPLAVYELPLDGADTAPRWVDLQWGDDGAPLLAGTDYWAGGVAFDPATNTLWMSDWKNHRVFRISDYDDIGDGVVHIDMVLGQPDKATTGCNHYEEPYRGIATTPAAADSLCEPHLVRFDRLGNLYVVEGGCECHGNNRVVVFMADDLRAASGMFPGTEARKVFIQRSLTSLVECGHPGGGRAVPLALAFNSRNQMVLGMDGYYGDEHTRARRQAWFFDDPLETEGGAYVQDQPADYFINLPLGSAVGFWFDEEDRLVVQDGTWPRLWTIDLGETDDFGQPYWLVPAPPDTH